MKIQMDPVTGNFPGWHFISLGLGLLFALAAALLFVLFLRDARKGKLCSYRTVARLGLAVFLAVVAFLRLRYFIRYGENSTFYAMIISLMFSAQTIMLETSPFVGIVAAALLVSNLWLIRHEGFYLCNFYALGVCFLMVLGIAGGIYISYYDVHMIFSNAAVNIYCMLFCYFECQYLAVVVCGVAAAAHTPEFDKDFVLILGCKIREDGTLYPIVRGRVDRAIAFVKEQLEKTGKQALFLPTGGKGSDEKLSEAAAMKRYLLEQGIPEEQIVTETESTTTRENMIFSKAIIDRMKENAKLAFSTTSFHVFRSGILAQDEGLEIDGMGSRTKWYFWPNAFMREFIGLLAASWKGQLIIIAIVSLFAGCVTLAI